MESLEKEKDPLVSIIMPCYNMENFLEESILSVLKQSYKNYELIIVDNGSSDGTLDIIYKYLDENIILLEVNKNKGVVGSRNEGVRKAKGKYIAFLDSDDIWYPEKLSKQILFMEKNDLAISCTEYNIVCEQGKYLYKFKIKEDIIDYSKNLKFNHLGCSTVIYNVEKLGKVFFFKKAVYKEDYGLWQKIMKKGIGTHVYKEALVDYRLRRGSISSNKFKMAKEQWKYYIRIEKLNILKTGYYFTNYIIKNIFKNIQLKLK